MLAAAACRCRAVWRAVPALSQECRLNGRQEAVRVAHALLFASAGEWEVTARVVPLADDGSARVDAAWWGGESGKNLRIIVREPSSASGQRRRRRSSNMGHHPLRSALSLPSSSSPTGSSPHVGPLTPYPPANANAMWMDSPVSVSSGGGDSICVPTPLRMRASSPSSAAAATARAAMPPPPPLHSTGPTSLDASSLHLSSAHGAAGGGDDTPMVHVSSAPCVVTAGLSNGFHVDDASGGSASSIGSARSHDAQHRVPDSRGTCDALEECFLALWSQSTSKTRCHSEMSYVAALLSCVVMHADDGAALLSSRDREDVGGLVAGCTSLRHLVNRTRIVRSALGCNDTEAHRILTSAGSLAPTPPPLPSGSGSHLGLGHGGHGHSHSRSSHSPSVSSQLRHSVPVGPPSLLASHGGGASGGFGGSSATSSPASSGTVAFVPDIWQCVSRDECGRMGARRSPLSTPSLSLSLSGGHAEPRSGVRALYVLAKWATTVSHPHGAGGGGGGNSGRESSAGSGMGMKAGNDTEVETSLRISMDLLTSAISEGSVQWLSAATVQLIMARLHHSRVCGCGGVVCCVVLGWVGLGWVGLGWVGLGWVGLGWVGLGWVGLGAVLVDVCNSGTRWPECTWSVSPRTSQPSRRRAVLPRYVMGCVWRVVCDAVPGACCRADVCRCAAPSLPVRD